MIDEKIPQEKDSGRCLHMTSGKHSVRGFDDLWHIFSLDIGLHWQGIPILKNQFDLARYFSLIHRFRPEVILETGCWMGGSTMFFMEALSALKLTESLYIGIDILGKWHPLCFEYPIDHIFIKRDCLAEETVNTVRPYLEGRRSLIVLDSVHTEEHVAEELRLYSPLSTSNSYLIVEDTDHNGRPVYCNYGPSAGEAVDKFLASGAPFVPDRLIERMFGSYTNCPGAWLRRT